jgi:predicted Zn-dependent protease
MALLRRFFLRWFAPAGSDLDQDDHYLSACVGAFVDAAGRKSLRHFHWNADDFPLRVAVSTPDGLVADDAEAYRQAVIAGFNAWQAHAPDLVRLEFVAEATEAHLAPTWVDHFEKAIGGHCYYDVAVGDDGRSSMRVTTFELALRTGTLSSPPHTPYSLPQITRTATHEMGHALGLGHSRRRGDIMFPDFSKEGWSISARDLRTLHRLYAEAITTGA